MKKEWFLMYRAMLAVVMVCCCAPVVLSADQSPQQLEPAQQVEIINRLGASFVHVEYTLRFDKGDPPQISEWGERCPNCGGYHGSGNGEQFVEQERPFEKTGMLIGPDLVLTADIMTHPRFLEKIQVRLKDHVVPASIQSYAVDHDAVLLKLAEPLTAGQPLTFDAQKKEPYYLVSCQLANAQWTQTLKPFAGIVCTRENGSIFMAVKDSGIVVDNEGTPVGVSMDNQRDLGDAWKGSPADWKYLSSEQLEQLYKEMHQTADRNLLRVTLNFRSPKARSPQQRYMMMDNNDNENITEKHTVGILTDPQTVLILANLKNTVTARLERITVYTPSGEIHSATFDGSLKDYGALIAKLEKPMPSHITFSDKDILGYSQTLLPTVQLIIQGEKRTAYYSHQRLWRFETGWRQQVNPELPISSENMFIFDQNCRLIAMPVIRREKVSQKERWYQEREPVLTASVYLKPVMDHIAEAVDSGNIPLTEEEENRMAWLGVELQPLDKDLARIHQVSDLTNDGETGAIVSYVYPDSPAAKAGIEPGAILLRLYVATMPKPIDINMQEDYFMDEFPWDQLDQVPEEYLDQIPQPWPGAANAVTKALTEIGFGTPYQAEFFIDGKRVRKQFVVEQSPPYYGSAEKFKSEKLGMTVKNLTYEVRRYFQKLPEDPGVIVSKIEPGSKASISGIKPYEIIIHVNDQPIHSVDDFKKLITDQAELKLSVKRMDQGRVVKIKMTD